MEWWEEFFKGDWVGIHTSFWTEAQTTSHADSIERLLELEPGSTVLDVPCGEGRIARQLAARGYRVTGVVTCRGTARSTLWSAGGAVSGTSTRQAMPRSWGQRPAY